MYTHIHAYGKPYLVPLWPLFGFMDFQSEKKNINFVENHLMIIPTNFGSNLTSGIRQD